jgi:NADPH-dependent curcumin reductase CurA
VYGRPLVERQIAGCPSPARRIPSRSDGLPSAGAVCSIPGRAPTHLPANPRFLEECVVSTPSREVRFLAVPEAEIAPENFEIVRTDVQDPGPSEVLVRNLYMSVDPAMRPRLSSGQAKLGSTLAGGALGKIVQSNHKTLGVGQYVLSQRGFREWFVSDGNDLNVVEPGTLPVTAYLSVLGVTGLTAYGGLLFTGQLKEGETVFVSAAAGAVGSIAGQIAKIKRCRVIGSCGSDEKVAYLKDELGFDHAFNYKTSDIREQLRLGAPDGIDVYFENVGGAHLDAALTCMRPLGRIPVCGMISAYNTKGARSEGVTTLSSMIYNRITMRGFVVYEFFGQMQEFRREMTGWLEAGKLAYKETILEGIENAPVALAGLFTGLNTGKMLVRLAADA